MLSTEQRGGAEQSRGEEDAMHLRQLTLESLARDVIHIAMVCTRPFVQPARLDTLGTPLQSDGLSAFAGFLFHPSAP